MILYLIAYSPDILDFDSSKKPFEGADDKMKRSWGMVEQTIKNKNALEVEKKYTVVYDTVRIVLYLETISPI